MKKRNKVGEKYIVVKKSELSAEGTKRDVENTPKFTRPAPLSNFAFSVLISVRTLGTRS